MASRAISVRLDECAQRALASLEALGMSRSEAVRRALHDSAKALRLRHAVRAEIAMLETDEGDRREMLEVAALMVSLKHPSG